MGNLNTFVQVTNDDNLKNAKNIQPNNFNNNTNNNLNNKSM